jgi:glucose-6-phosphate 1-dehydrogenase
MSKDSDTVVKMTNFDRRRIVVNNPLVIIPGSHEQTFLQPKKKAKTIYKNTAELTTFFTQQLKFKAYSWTGVQFVLQNFNNIYNKVKAIFLIFNSKEMKLKTKQKTHKHTPQNNKIGKW